MSQTKSPKTDTPNTSPTKDIDPNTPERRAFLKKLGKYSAVTSVTTVTLMTANKASAFSIPPPPGGTGGSEEPEGTWPD